MARLREPEKQPGVLALEAEAVVILGGSIIVTASLSLQSGPTLSSAHTRLGQIHTMSGLVTVDEMATRAQRKQVALPGHKPRAAYPNSTGLPPCHEMPNTPETTGTMAFCLTKLAG